MATKIVIIYILITFYNFSQAQPESDKSHNDIDYWCQTTPHPTPCNHFLSHDFQFTPQNHAEFRLMLVHVTLDRALQAQNSTDGLANVCDSKRKKAVWDDCNKLVQDTIWQLNRTLQCLQINTTATAGSIDDEFAVDAQTWLSAALTDIETCRLGSIQLNVSDFIEPIMSNNVSEMISNSLAINGAVLADVKGEYDHKSKSDDVHFPGWVTEGDRKLLQTTSSWASMANVVVAKDGSGHFRSIQEAINYAARVRRRGNGRFIIYVKRGVYWENIAIGYDLNKIMLVGDGLRYTIISGSRSVASGFTTYSSATAGIDGIGFMATGITFRNTAGPQNGQAVALRSASDLSVFYACGFEGYQDTLFVHAQRQFYKFCYIYGTIDFIFGNAAVVFQSCLIYVRRPLLGQINVITAQGRDDPYQNTGISIHQSRIMAAPDLKPVVRAYKTYLGRPWQQYSRTVLMKNYIDNFVSPKGWLPWMNTNFGWDTLYYGEYSNFGPGASTTHRVKWRGYHLIRSAYEASKFTVAKFISGRAWLPSTGVPFIAGL